MAIHQSFETHSLTPPNLLPEEPQQQQPGRPPRRKTRFFSCALLVILLFVTSCTVLLARSNHNFFVGVKNGFLLRQLTHLFTGSNYSLKGEDQDRINFLLLGMGGPGHEGPYLSDTIILASFKPSTKEVALLSIPRDLIVTSGNGIYQKINSVYALNINKGAEHAFAETKRVIGETFNTPIDYMGVVDFQGFVELINNIGGVDVTDNQHRIGFL